MDNESFAGDHSRLSADMNVITQMWVCGGDATACQITLYSCSLYLMYQQSLLELYITAERRDESQQMHNA